MERRHSPALRLGSPVAVGQVNRQPTGRRGRRSRAVACSKGAWQGGSTQPWRSPHIQPPQPRMWPHFLGSHRAAICRCRRPSARVPSQPASRCCVPQAAAAHPLRSTSRPRAPTSAMRQSALDGSSRRRQVPVVFERRTRVCRTRRRASEPPRRWSPGRLPGRPCC